MELKFIWCISATSNNILFFSIRISAIIVTNKLSFGSITSIFLPRTVRSAITAISTTYRILTIYATRATITISIVLSMTYAVSCSIVRPVSTRLSTSINPSCVVIRRRAWIGVTLLLLRRTPVTTGASGIRPRRCCAIRPAISILISYCLTLGIYSILSLLISISLTDIGRKWTTHFILGYGNRRTILAASTIVSGENLTCLTGPSTSALCVSKSLTLGLNGSLSLTICVFLTYGRRKRTAGYIILVYSNLRSDTSISTLFCKLLAICSGPGTYLISTFYPAFICSTITFVGIDLLLIRFASFTFGFKWFRIYPYRIGVVHFACPVLVNISLTLGFYGFLSQPICLFLTFIGIERSAYHILCYTHRNTMMT